MLTHLRVEPGRCDGIMHSMKFAGVCTCDAAAALKALRITSVTRWLVSTLPPTTAASGDGLRIVLGGILTVTGFRQPCKNLYLISMLSFAGSHRLTLPVLACACWLAKEA